MSETTDRRRGHGEDGIYLDAARNRYMGAVSLGYGPDGKRVRRKVSGKTKQEVRADRADVDTARSIWTFRVPAVQLYMAAFVDRPATAWSG